MQTARAASILLNAGWAGAVSDVRDNGGINDTTGMSSPFTPSRSDALVLALDPLIDPNTHTNHVFQIRLKQHQANGDQLNAVINLRNRVSRTLIAARSVNMLIDGTIATLSVPLTQAEAAAIENYAEIDVEVLPSVVIQPGTRRVIEPTDFVHRGVYKLPYTEFKAGSKGVLCYAADRGTWFVVGNAVNNYPIYELVAPTAPPSLLPVAQYASWPSFTMAPGGDFMAGRGGAEAFWKLIQLFPDNQSGDQINGLLWDAPERILWVALADSYGVHPKDPSLCGIDFRVSPPLPFGPFSVNNVCSRRGGGGVQFAPPEIQAATGRDLIMFGYRDSTGQDDPQGPAFYSVAKPTRSTPRCVRDTQYVNTSQPYLDRWIQWTVMDHAVILHFEGVLVSAATGAYSYYNWPHDWYWTSEGGSHQDYMGSPYRIHSELAVNGHNHWSAFGGSVKGGKWIDVGDKWGVVYPMETLPPGGMCFYGTQVEIGDPNRPQTFENVQGQPINRPKSVAVFPEGVNGQHPLIGQNVVCNTGYNPSGLPGGLLTWVFNGEIYDSHKGTHGSHYERQYHSYAIYDPQTLIDGCPGLLNPTANGRYVAQELLPAHGGFLLRAQYPTFRSNEGYWYPGAPTTVSYQRAEAAPPEFVPSTRMLYVPVMGAYDHNGTARPLINVFELL